MIRDTAQQLSAAFEDLGWNHSVAIQGTDHILTLGISEMSGAQMLQLFGVLAPNAVPLPDISVKLTSGIGVTIQ